MTTIVALKDKDGVYIGSDRQATAGFFAMQIKGETGKWVISEDGRWAVGHCGRFRTQNIISEEREALFHKISDPGDFVNRLQDVLKRYEFDLRPSKGKDDDGDSDRHNNMDSWLILCSSDSIYAIDHDFTVLEIEDFIARGSGFSFAMGALSATDGMKIKPEERVESALAISAKYDVYTGSETFIAVMK